MKVVESIDPVLPESDERSNQGLLLLILFVSGFCSLAYQVVWLREFRLLFGASTPATSAVLAVFMGGLGLGGAILGKRVEKSRRPARFYGLVELGISITTLLTPLLLLIGSKIYIASGGSIALGGVGSSLVRIGLTALVIGVPCFLMGGTLPAALSFAQSDSDEKRVTTSVFYGVNIIGALCGAFAANFILLYLLGNFLTLVLAVLFNFGISALVLVIIARYEPSREIEVTDKNVVEDSNGKRIGQGDSHRLIYAVAFLSGFVFFVAELVWYRVSIPLLGGSVYNFGLILSVVLAGMGVGGLLYALILRYVKPTATLVAGISLLMAFFILLPFLCGDWFAYFTLSLQSATIGFPFSDKIISWSVITAALVFPAALFAGMQFPALISLLGSGNSGIARQTGNAYAWNTLGAILGSLLGGFVFIPAFSLTGTWRWVSIIALLLAGLLLCTRMNKSKSDDGQSEVFGRVVILIAMVCIFIFGVTSVGPRAYWLQSPIGFGRMPMPSRASKADIVDLFRASNRREVTAFDGREASVALVSGKDLSLYANGKSDGSARGDAGTQVMLPLIPALLHPGVVKNACVIGLGTGTSAGWLAAVPSVEKVDVIELEPQLFDKIGPFSPVNKNCLDNPKVNPIVGDAREILLIKGESYDLIASEPSNPHRAGVANLYTREYYLAVSDRLTQEGVFAQWLQSYEIDNETMSLIITTLSSVFPRVEIYQTLGSDVVFVCTKEDKPWDLPKIRSRIKEEPFKSALTYTWGVESAEGFFCRSIGNNNIVKVIAQNYGLINSDGHNRLEFALGRTIGGKNLDFPCDNIWRLAVQNNWEQPPLTDELDQKKLKRAMIANLLVVGRTPDRIFSGTNWLSEENLKTYATFNKFNSQPAQFLKEWNFEPQNWLEIHMELRALALVGDKRFMERVNQLGESWPIDKAAFTLIYYDVIGDHKNAQKMSRTLFQAMRDHTWCRMSTVDLAVGRIGRVISGMDPSVDGKQLMGMFDLLEKPFPAYLIEDARLEFRTALSQKISPEHRLKALEGWGADYPFNIAHLEFRVVTFKELSDPRLLEAEAELARCRELQ